MAAASESYAATDAGLLRRAVTIALDVAERADYRVLPWQRDAAPHGVEVSVYLTDDEEMHALNLAHRGVDRTTDVLSFSLVAEQEGPEVAYPVDWPRALGDIVLSVPYAERQAASLGHSVDMELAWLTIHGTLQLLGYTHETDDRAERMEALERQALGALGFSPG